MPWPLILESRKIIYNGQFTGGSLEAEVKQKLAILISVSLKILAY